VNNRHNPQIAGFMLQVTSLQQGRNVLGLRPVPVTSGL
jgi:hypothetical protein